MKARPILFSAPMIRSLLSGTKTQTRRIIREPDDGVTTCINGGEAWIKDEMHSWKRRWPPYGRIGDLLWVRESIISRAAGNAAIYRADHNEMEAAGLSGMYGGWKPSIHMPRRFSRLTLEITDVRVQRLKSISEMDAYAEGIDTEGDAYIAAEHGKLGGAGGPAPSVCAYADLWDSINGSGSWEKNSWVWMLAFKVHKQNIDDFLRARAA